MLQNIRDKAQGWIAYGIVILISIPFALWGIQEYLGIGSEPVVAKVNGTEITERALDNQFQSFRQQLRAQLGSAYRPELFNDDRMRLEVLNRMVRDELIEQASNDMGLRVSGIEVQTALIGMEPFQKDGHFDQATFERAVRLQGLTPAGFMERIRKLLLSQQLAQAVGVSTFVTQHEEQEAQRLMNQQREFSYFTIPVADYRLETPVADDKIEAYYQAHQADFAVPERVKLRYIHLDATIAGGTIEVSTEALKNYYNDHQEKFGLPEQRKASHILIQVAQDADDAAVAEAKSRIEALSERLAQGEDFAELAKANSQDPGSASNGGDLGYFGKGVMDPAFEKAVFELEPGQVSEPVRSSFGFHLIKLVDIKSGHVKPFEEAKAEVERAYRKDEGERLYFEMAERLADLAYEDPGSLEPAANELGLTIQHSDWVTREQGEGILSSPKVLGAAFSEDVLVGHNNSELIELDTESSVVLRVEEHEEASTRPLDEVRDQIVEQLRLESAEAQAQAEADKRKQEIEGGAPIQQVAGELSIAGPLTMKRTDRSVAQELLNAVFTAPKPTEGGSVVDSAKLANGDVAVYVLQSVSEGDAAEEGAGKMLVQSLSRDLERSLYDHLVADLKSRADIEILIKQNEPL
jgi:peptidyl-prolyl cis-trans isomerase D